MARSFSATLADRGRRGKSLKGREKWRGEKRTTAEFPPSTLVPLRPYYFSSFFLSSTFTRSSFRQRRAYRVPNIFTRIQLVAVSEGGFSCSKTLINEPSGRSSLPPHLVSTLCCHGGKATRTIRVSVLLSRTPLQRLLISVCPAALHSLGHAIDRYPFPPPLPPGRGEEER